jgi:predicted N-acetyltransferase YhbS
VSFRIVAFERDHAKRAFACGNAPLDRYWREYAHQDLRRGIATAHVLIENETDTVAGYYTLSAASVTLQSLPLETQRKLPPYPQIPVALLGRLAVATTYKDRSFGAMLVYDAATRVRASGVGCYAIVADPIDDATAFYRHLGFLALKGERRLFAPLTALASEP